MGIRHGERQRIVEDTDSIREGDAVPPLLDSALIGSHWKARAQGRFIVCTIVHRHKWIPVGAASAVRSVRRPTVERHGTMPVVRKTLQSVGQNYITDNAAGRQNRVGLESMTVEAHWEGCGAAH